MIFHSLLFPKTYELKEETPDFFIDLNINQILDALIADKQEYDLRPFFYTPLNDPEAVKYRQEVFQDLENINLLAKIKSFSQKMGTMRNYLAQADKLSYKYHKERWFLEAVEIYCDAVNCLVHDLLSANLKSRGLLGFLEYLTEYANSERYILLQAETKKLLANLSSVKYCLLIKGGSVKVRKYESEIDYSAIIEETFQRFKQGAAKDYRVQFADRPEDMNHVEAAILDLVAKLYPDIFCELDEYYAKNKNFLEEKIRVFDREIQFYIAYLDFIAILRQAGLNFCYPRITDKSKEIYNYEGFDLALAYKHIKEKKSIVCNDFFLKGKERIIVVTGPNQGGKTTFARTFGQLHYLASLGCLVPGRDAQLYLYDKLFTHFEREEDIRALRGKLQDDLVRMHSILEQATSDSIVVINEIFNSTTIQDGIFLSKKVMEKIIELGLLCLWVTFIDELASFGEQTVSMVSTVDPEDPTLRTYKFIRKPADGLAYATAIAKKYRLTYDDLRSRLKL